MTSSTKIDVTTLGTVQETLLIPLWARARESREPNPILCDPKAAEIVASLDYDFARFEQETKLTQVVACVLATIFDRWTRKFLDEHPDGTIVEIGAGLDTRYERLDNGRARWFELDLPDAIAVRRQFFDETIRRQFVAMSALEPAWTEMVAEASAGGPVLILAEAVLLYFEEADVRRLFALIADRFPGALVAFDTCGRLAQRNSRKLEAVRLTGAEFRWGIDDVHEIEHWDPRFHVLEVDSVMNHYRQRFGWGLRALTTVLPVTRRLFTVNLCRFG
ncbi:MAG: class I SAM-dependent methyltransferase [Pirellulales bacterium]|nr:class I SAM-dependent methyltransferase [Pirellulales bacterium]